MVLDPNAEPPDRFRVDIEGKGGRTLRETFSYGRKKDLGKDPSAFDFSLALQLLGRDYADQEIADTVIAFRRRHKLKWPEKVTRDDYIPRTIARAREAQQGAGQLAKLPFSLARRIQHGRENARYELVLEGGEVIPVEDTDTMMSGRRMRNRLAEAGYILSEAAASPRTWAQIIAAMMPITEVRESETEAEVWRERVDEYLARSLVLWEDGGDEEYAQQGGPRYTRTGEVFIRASNLAEYLVMKWKGTATGYFATSTVKVAQGLGMLGFRKEKREGYNVWVSPPGFAWKTVEYKLKLEAEREETLGRDPFADELLFPVEPREGVNKAKSRPPRSRRRVRARHART